MVGEVLVFLIVTWKYNKKENNNIIYGIYIALYPDAQSALQHFVGDFCQTAYLGAHCRHAVHNLIEENSRIHRCPQNRISDKPSHGDNVPYSFQQYVGSLTSHTSTVRRGLRFIVLIMEDLIV